MTQQIALERYTSVLYELFDETFEKSSGIYLDSNNSLFETLDTISAEEASIPVSATCGTLAAQTEHIRFYLDVIEAWMIDSERNPVKLDWGEIWRTVSVVTPEEWGASKARLRASYERIIARLKSVHTWEGENDIGIPLTFVVHTAYHLGEIRQALCTIKQR
jgi:hypothetical protein